MTKGDIINQLYETSYNNRAEVKRRQFVGHERSWNFATPYNVIQKEIDEQWALSHERKERQERAENIMHKLSKMPRNIQFVREGDFDRSMLNISKDKQVSSFL